ncbi:MAG: 2-C-methyl-D-erythritol 4-phosphate cytidylyltransferase [Acidaminococcaceae bacterium]|nr:2-C-methyl-D-erythritol 4-phosphate cytidylyltransferase [Acidaminococcaceae bacterium]
MEKLNVIIAAAGKGTRLGMGMNKAFVKLAGVPIIVHNLRQLNNLPDLGTVFIVVGAGELTEAEKMLQKYQAGIFPSGTLAFGSRWQAKTDSVENALAQIKEKTGWIAVHDGARPFAARELFAEVWTTARKTGAAIAAVPARIQSKKQIPKSL